MKSGKARILIASGLALMAGVAGAQNVGPFGPPMGVKAEVVRSFAMKTTGAVVAEVQGKMGDRQTGLRGQCDPSKFANFAFEKGSSYDQAEISIISNEPIKTGVTGEIKLDKIYVRFFDLKNDERRFGGPGKLTLTVHDASKGKRRMAGTIIGSELEGLENLSGKFLDVTATFDADFSCGVK